MSKPPAQVRSVLDGLPHASKRSLMPQVQDRHLLRVNGKLCQGQMCSDSFVEPDPFRSRVFKVNFYKSTLSGVPFTLTFAARGGRYSEATSSLLSSTATSGLTATDAAAIFSSR